MNALRQVLAEVRSAHNGASLDEIARRVGVSRGEVEAMIDYWVGRSELSIEEIGPGCSSGGCGGCSQGRNGQPGCGKPSSGPVLIGITVRPR